jgi:Cdc6-like AAA superfamily ATPase
MNVDLYNVFSPGQEILEPDKFSGRRENISQAIKVLLSPGASMIVYGERGVGKTSFLEMVKLIAQDQVELIHRYKLQNLKPKTGFKYKIIAIECDEDVQDTEKVLRRLITSPEGINGLLVPQIDKIETTSKNRLSINLFKKILSLGIDYEEKTTRSVFKEESIYELFTNLVLSIVQNILPGRRITYRCR